MIETRTVGILLFDDVEVLDFAGPFEVFSVAARISPEPTPFTVLTVARKTRVAARGGLLVQPSVLLDACPKLDLLIVPGGVVDAELQRTELIDWVRRTSSRAEITASVCTGAFLLAAGGLLDGLRVTTHWEDATSLATRWPALKVEADARFIDNGRLVTSAGIASGIDMALHLVARLAGRALASQTARQMDYPWREAQG